MVRAWRGSGLIEDETKKSSPSKTSPDKEIVAKVVQESTPVDVDLSDFVRQPNPPGYSSTRHHDDTASESESIRRTNSLQVHWCKNYIKNVIELMSISPLCYLVSIMNIKFEVVCLRYNPPTLRRHHLHLKCKSIKKKWFFFFSWFNKKNNASAALATMLADSLLFIFFANFYFGARKRSAPK